MRSGCDGTSTGRWCHASHCDNPTPCGCEFGHGDEAEPPTRKKPLQAPSSKRRIGRAPPRGWRNVGPEHGLVRPQTPGMCQPEVSPRHSPTNQAKTPTPHSCIPKNTPSGSLVESTSLSSEEDRSISRENRSVHTPDSGTMVLWEGGRRSPTSPASGTIPTIAVQPPSQPVN